MLQSCIQKSFVAHAYLFTGPKGSGKTTTALAFAAALNCSNPTPSGDACGQCLSCMRIQGSTDADVTVISPDGNQTKMEQMQEMIKKLGFAPLSGRYKVFILEQADTLNASSENCILKILEEPPPYAVLILLSSNQNALLPTIRSRCRSVRFRGASMHEITAALKERCDVPDDELQILAACAQGTIGRAFRMSASPAFMEERQIVLQALKDWAAGPPVLGLQTAELLRSEATDRKSAKGDPESRTLVGNLTGMVDHILSWYADLLAVKVRGIDAPVTNMDYLDDLTAHSERYSTNRLQHAIRSIIETRRYIEGNITPQLALENMFFEMQPDM